MHKFFKINQHALLKSSTNKILILEQEGKWMLPGGRVEGMGSPEEELKREIKEETGIEDSKIEGVFDTGISSSGETFLITYRAKVEGEPKIKISEEHTDYAWVDKNNIDDYKFWYEVNKEKILIYLG
jgi:8-oxo-dGTP pyrophosphatase MutT (NUDIX family)